MLLPTSPKLGIESLVGVQLGSSSSEGEKGASPLPFYVLFITSKKYKQPNWANFSPQTRILFIPTWNIWISVQSGVGFYFVSSGENTIIFERLVIKFLLQLKNWVRYSI